MKLCSPFNESRLTEDTPSDRGESRNIGDDTRDDGQVENSAIEWLREILIAVVIKGVITNWSTGYLNQLVPSPA